MLRGDRAAGAVDFQPFAPEIVASPKVSMYRIYRDTRFSADKTPLKTNVAASFPWRGLHRHQGAGLYFEVAPRLGVDWRRDVRAGAGRSWSGSASTSPTRGRRSRRLTRAKAFETLIGGLGGEKLTRVPRGYPADHPAAGDPAPQAVPRRRASCPPRPRRVRTSTRRSSRRSRPSCRWCGF